MNKEFIKKYNDIFNTDYKKAISNAVTKYMFVNYQGIMFGEGNYNLWISEVKIKDNQGKLMIKAINN